MKRAYTQFVAEYRDAIKQGKREDFFAPIIAEQIRLRPQDAHELILMAHRITMECRILDGEATHFFMPGKPFCDWVRDAGKSAKSEHIFNAVCGNHTDEEIVKWEHPDFGKVIVLHFPTGIGFRSTAFMLCRVVTVSGQYGVLENASYQRAEEYDWSYTHFNIGGGIPCDHPQVRKGQIPLFVGLSLYLSCFPETIINGLPSDLKHPSHHKHKDVFTVGISEKVKLGGTHDSPTPHFRVGHFRVLRSEKFTNKRFQTVFVHETFVKGTAKTVLSPEQVTA
jgi:hypothetical protein